MLVTFKELPDESRVWIYQSNRIFTNKELNYIRAYSYDFLKKWTAHGSNLQAGIDIPYDRFIVIGLNESIKSATGCSIDSSVRFIQTIESKFNIVLLDKMNVTYRVNNNNIDYTPLKNFIIMAKKKLIHENVIVFNNLVVNKKEYRTQWEVPASFSWHSRYFKK
tara:strand:- start:5253 stop:5744 length:492 start_codon:yes stop_codon:yes gene_type:complete